METQTSLATAQQIAAHVRSLLAQRMKESASDGELLTYAELNGLINGDVRGEYLSSFNTARKKVQSEYGVMFKTIRGQGIQVMSTEEKLSCVGKDARSRINSATSTWRKGHESIKPSDLTDQNMIKQFTAETLRLNLQEDLNSGRKELQVETAVEKVATSNLMEWKSLKQTLHAATQEMAHIG